MLAAEVIVTLLRQIGLMVIFTSSHFLGSSKFSNYSCVGTKLRLSLIFSWLDLDYKAKRMRGLMR